MEKYKIDSVSDTVKDILQQLGAIHFTEGEDAKKKAAENFFGAKGPELFTTLTKLLDGSKPGAILGDKVSS